MFYSLINAEQIFACLLITMLEPSKIEDLINENQLYWHQLERILLLEIYLLRDAYWKRKYSLLKYILLQG